MISIGCAMAAYGELHFEMFGFLCQASAVAVSSLSHICMMADMPVRGLVSSMDHFWSLILMLQTTGDDSDPATRAKGMQRILQYPLKSDNLDGSPRFTPLLRSSKSPHKPSIPS